MLCMEADQVPTSSCSNCHKNTPAEGRRWCGECLAYGRDAKAKFRSKPKPEGSCSRTDCMNTAAPGRKSCDACRLREEAYEAQHKDPIALRARQARRRLRVLVFEKYGGAFCACCQEDRYEFLTIDHVAGDGARHRRENKAARQDIYFWLKKNNFPPGYRVLCMNCNFALGYHGYCPHHGWVQPTSNGRLGRPKKEAACFGN